MEKVNPKATFNIFMSAQDCANLTEDELNVFVMDVVNYNQEDNDSMILILQLLPFFDNAKSASSKSPVPSAFS